MKIQLYNKGKRKRFSIIIPMPLWILKYALKYDDELKDLNVDFNNVYKELRKFKREHPNFVIFEVKESNGDTIRITL